MIYLDHAATTPLSPLALSTLLSVAQETTGNPSSIHAAGRQANQVLRQARQTIARCLQVADQQILFTSGGSESDTLAIQGYALANQDKGRHLITTAIEHHAVLHTMHYLEESFGFEVTYLQPINQQISAQQVRDALRPDTILVSMMYANNETGQLLPIREVGQMLSDHQAVFHVDAVQAIGKLPIFPEEEGIDLLSASAHKFHGPKGVGFLYSRLPKLDALIRGGRQEQGYRAGTENLPAIAAMAVALEEADQNRKQHTDRLDHLHAHLLDGLTGLSYYHNAAGPHLPHVLNLGFPNQLNEQLLMRLDLAGIALSSGSACTAGLLQPSHVLAAMYGKDSPRLRESIRISLSHTTTLDEIDTFLSHLHLILGG